MSIKDTIARYHTAAAQILEAPVIDPASPPGWVDAHFAEAILSIRLQSVGRLMGRLVQELQDGYGTTGAEIARQEVRRLADKVEAMIPRAGPIVSEWPIMHEEQ